MSDILGIGVIGIGDHMQRSHLPYLNGTDSRLVALCDLDEEALRALSETYPGVVTTTSEAELLENPEVQLVMIGTPDQFHADSIRRALEAGKHVMCEKPLAAYLFIGRQKSSKSVYLNG